MSGDSDACSRPEEVDPRRMEVFVEAMMPPCPRPLQGLEQDALARGIPVIRPGTQDLLRFFLTMKRPARILEIGAAVGFSALFMQAFAPAGCRIVTIEKDPARAQEARRNFVRYGISADSPEQRTDSRDSLASVPAREGESGAGCPLIGLLEGDAAQILPQIREDGAFDLIFMDAAKGQYIRFLPEAVRLLAEGGLLITDNILREGEVLSSRFAVTRRNRTIHHRMREYIEALTAEPALETLLLPSGDGAAVSVKKPAPPAADR